MLSDSVTIARDPSAAILSMHADWHLADPEGFRRAAAGALEAARTQDALVTVGLIAFDSLAYIIIVRKFPVLPASQPATR